MTRLRDTNALTFACLTQIRERVSVTGKHWLSTARQSVVAAMPRCALTIVWWIGVPILFTPVAAFAQTATIAGTVSDSTGAVLPGVTVEASSPALIEKVRLAVTDSAGQYKIVALPPGLFAVSFTLPGFSGVRKDGIELTTGFTASVNAELPVGSVQETLTVSGSAPIVDVQNVRRQDVITRDFVDALPTGKILYEMATLLPGVQMIDAGRPATAMGGASARDNFAQLTAHGGRTGDTVFLVNGHDVTMFGQVQSTAFVNPQDGNVQEYTVEVSGNSVETESGGVRVNVVIKDGGNQFTGSLFANFANDALAADNMSDELRADGLRDPDRLKNIWSVNPSFGGPIKRDRIWFYGGYARMVSTRYKAGMYVNTTPAAWRPTFDLNQQASAGDDTHDASLRLTWQATTKHKLVFFYEYNRFCQCPYGTGTTYLGTNAPEAASISPRYTKLPQVTWTAPFTNRLLIEAGVSRAQLETTRRFLPETVAPRILEASTGLAFRAPSFGWSFDDLPTTTTPRASVSYVTGSHASKFGVDARVGQDVVPQRTFQNIEFTTLNYRPISVTYHATPYTWQGNLKQFAAFGQDQWSIRRLTLNLGARYDYYQQSVPDQHLPATEYMPNVRDLPGSVLLRWHDVSPRLGAAYDLFGSGRTAVKYSIGRYLVRHPIYRQTNPAAQNATVTRQWTNPNGDFLIQGDPLNTAANGELGPSQNLNFGRPVVSSRFDSTYAYGFGERPFNWESSASIQHEVLPRVSVTGSYLWRWFGNFQVTDNLLVSPADYDPYCVTAPTDVRLPGDVSGQPICGLFDLKPAKVGQSDAIITSSARYGSQTEHWNGGDFSVQVRLPGRALLNGGVSLGKTTADNCDVVTQIDNPSERFCHLETPYLMQVKASGSYVLPWGIETAATVQSFNGPARQAVATFTNAQIVPSLGRNLSTGATASVLLLPSQPIAGQSGTAPAVATYYGDRITQVDLRFAKSVKVGPYRMKGMVDIYNAFNINTPTVYNSTYGTNGSSWTPLGIALARYAKLGLQIDF